MICNLLRLTKKIHVKMEAGVIISFLLFLKDEIKLIFYICCYFFIILIKNNYLFFYLFLKIILIFFII